MKKKLLLFIFILLSFNNTFADENLSDISFSINGETIYGDTVYEKIDKYLEKKAENLEQKKIYYEKLINKISNLEEFNEKNNNVKIILEYGYTKTIEDIDIFYSKTQKISLGYTKNGDGIYAYYKGKPEDGYFGIFSNIHGGYEYGTYNTALYLKEELDKSGKSGRFIIPTINPEGLEYFKEYGYNNYFYIEGRVNSNNVDLNRNFCTSNFELKEFIKNGELIKSGIDSCGSEEETKIIVKTLEKYKFNKIISLHSQGNIIFLPDDSIEDDDVISFGKQISNILETYTFDIDYENIEEQKRKILEYEINEGGSGEYTGTMETYIYEKYNIPTILIELEYHGTIEYKLEGIIDLLD